MNRRQKEKLEKKGSQKGSADESAPLSIEQQETIESMVGSSVPEMNQGEMNQGISPEKSVTSATSSLATSMNSHDQQPIVIPSSGKIFYSNGDGSLSHGLPEGQSQPSSEFILVARLE